MKLKDRINNLLNQGRSIEFKITLSCLLIIILFALFIASVTIKNFGGYVDDNANNKSTEISKQIVNNYNNYINGIIDTFGIVVEELDDTDVINNPEHVEEFFHEVLQYQNAISNITLFNTEGYCLVNTSENVAIPAIVKSMLWFSEAIKQPTTHYFSSPTTTSTGESKIYVTRYVKYNIGTGRGVLLMEIDSNRIVDLAKNTNLGENGQIVIINSNQSVVFSSEDNVDNTMMKKIRSLSLGTDTVTVDSNKMSVNIETINHTRWRIAIFINIDESAAAQKSFSITLITISFVAILATAIVVSFLSKNIANPLKKLESAMKEIEEADYLIVEEVNIGKQKEIASLSESFNLMMRRIKELMDRVVEEQEAQRKSELKALQNQINPHFLYNTLDSIVWLVDNGKNKEASEMVVALAKLFRISISRGRNIITVKDELEHARSYLLIQSIRYANAFKYEFDIDPEVVEYTTMKLILQPLIENAIYHGLKNRIDEGELKITAHLVDNKIVFKVIDNGYGMKEERIEEIYTKFRNPDLNDGVGLKNVYLRLKIYYGEDADLLINSELDEGTTITIIIPLKTTM